MSCEICGRGSCTRAFHSLDAQQRHDEKQAMTDDVDDLREEVLSLRAEVEALRAALISIEEYWNRDQNERAMADACWHAINTARAALSGGEEG